MEDRYLFKGKRANNGEWVIGNLIWNIDAEDGWEAIIIPVKNSNMFTKHIGQGYGNLGFENWYRVDPSTICQCIGLKDKNGNLIWENDIVGRKAHHFEVVKYKDGDWTIDDSYAYDKETGSDYSNLGFYVRERKSVEAIGNIFDNPELLESEEI